jgi:hypothetical protein
MPGRAREWRLPGSVLAGCPFGQPRGPPVDVTRTAADASVRGSGGAPVMMPAWDQRQRTRDAGGGVAAVGIQQRPGSVASRVLELQRLAGNRAVRGALAAVQRAPDDAKPSARGSSPGPSGGATPETPKVTGFVGLNPGATKEAAGLKKASKQEVLTSFNDPAAEKLLQEDPAIGSFVTSELGFGVWDVGRMVQAATLLHQADPHLREQLADIMRWMSRAERGQIILDRMVLSGHSDGVKLWGDAEPNAESAPGIMVIERDLGAIAAVFPKAVGQVQDVMFSACFSINAVEIVRKIFPNLKSVWSYGGYSPSVKQGSLDHILTWERATQGEKTPTKREKRGSNAIWTRADGYIVGDPAQAAAGPLITEASRGGNELVGPYYRGEKEIDKATLDSFYTVLQRCQAHPGVDAHAKMLITTHVIPITLRLRHWRPISERFGKQFAEQLKPMYDALGMTAPNWSSLTRVQLKRHLDAIDQALETHPDAASHKAFIEDTLKKGLFKLDSKVIDESWI